MSVPLIQEGDQVVFKRDGSIRVFQVRKSRQVFFEKTKFSVDELIGQPYGSTFEIDRGRLVKFEPGRISELQTEVNTSTAGTDNRNLNDMESNQKMSKDDIMKMKDDGIAGEKIIEELIENSETFKNKTEFSQAKYLKKKKKKHMLVFTVLRPTPRLIMGIFTKEPSKICYLRPDSLSQLINYSNVMNGSNVAVVETCQGLVLACVLQRMGGNGKLIQLIPHSDNAVCRQVMDYFSFPKDQLDNVYSFPLNKLSSLSEYLSENSTSASQNVNNNSKKDLPAVQESELCIATCSSSQHSETLASTVTLDSSSNAVESSTLLPEVSDVEPMEEGQESPSVSAVDDASVEPNEVGNATGHKRPFAPDRELQRQRRLEREKEAAQIISSKKLNSLIIAAKYNPTPILMKMLEFLPPSSPVVVYCQYLEPLVECYTQIKQKGVGLQLKLSETWFREYQVLSHRTHPMMNMSGTGGYLLTFMTVLPENPHTNL